VVALSTDAKPDAMCVWPHTIRLKGMTLFNNPIIKKATHTFGLFGRLKPIKSTIIHNVMAASPTRNVTIVRGGNSATATPTKKKDPPHSRDRVISISHSRIPMDVLIDDVTVSPLQDKFVK
jgi:hypothetical protein